MVPGEARGVRVLHGTEMECSAYVYAQGPVEPRLLEGSEREGALTRLYRECRPEGIASLGTGFYLFLSNGARMYIDHGHPEYSTPECDSIRGAYVAAKAGERIISQTFQEGVKRGIISGYAIHKRVLNEAPYPKVCLEEAADLMRYTSVGAHVNTGIRYREKGVRLQEENLRLIGLGRATLRPQLTGAGAVLPRWPDGQGGTRAGYIMYQKAPFLCCDYSASTTRKRPVVNTREEPLAEPEERWVRLHNTSGDANILPYAELMAIGFDSVIAKLTDAGYKPPFAPGPGGLAHLAWHTACDLSCKMPAELDDGVKVRPIEVGEALVGLMRDYGEKYGWTPEEQWVVDEAQSTIDDLKAGRMQSLVGRLDWVSKLRLLERYKEKNGIAKEDWSDPRLVRQDQRYDLIACSDGARPSSAAFDKLPIVQELKATEQEMVDAMYTAPTSGRARLRGEFVAEHGITSPQERQGAKPSEDLVVSWQGVVNLGGKPVEGDDNDAQGRTYRRTWPLFTGTSGYSAAPITMLYNDDSGSERAS